jgi:uncharacterized membrane protein
MSPKLARRLLGPTFIGAGTLHFTHTDRYQAIMPPYVPMHREAVLVSGAAEIVGGVTSQIPRLSTFARWWLTGLLVAVFPANLHWALHPDQVRGVPKVPRALLWARLPFQLVFIRWVWRATQRPG